MTTTAVRASRWAGPAAVVVAALVVPALAGAPKRRHASRVANLPVVPPLTTRPATPATGTTGRAARVLFMVARWAARVTVVLATVLFLVVAIGPHTGRYRTLTVLSASMRPTVPAGSVVVVTPIPVADIAVGDIITYAAPVADASVVTHRVIEVVAPGAVRTRGDANNAPDPWVAQLRGTTAWKVRTDVPAVGYVLSALRGPVARVLTLGTTTALGVLFGLRAIWRRPSDA